MKVQALLAGILFGTLHLAGQAPAGAPANTNGLCKDGSYSTAPHKSGACSGHKGVQTWYAADSGASPKTANPGAAKPAVAPTATSVVPPGPAQVPAAPAAYRQQVSGGGPGMVWVNTSSKVYHCSGTAYYGKTKAGKYLSEADAKAEGDRPDHGKTCGQ